MICFNNSAYYKSEIGELTDCDWKKGWNILQSKNIKDTELSRLNNIMIVVTHKPYNPPESGLYKTIAVGQNKTILDIPDAWKDDEGINIANLNYRYCELTALYYLWKNRLNEYDHAGLTHYRRLFSRNSFSNAYKFLINDDDINSSLDIADIILPYRFRWKHSVMTHYYDFGFGKKKDLLLVGRIIDEYFPDYRQSYWEVLNGYSASYCNMFVMWREELSKYCEWLFKILKLFDERADVSGYTDTEMRVDGALSEILLNVWVIKRKLKVKYYPIAFIEASHKGQMIYGIKTAGQKLRIH